MPASNPFGQSAIADAVKDLPALPADAVNVGMVAKDGDIGVEQTANKTWKNGVFVEDDVSWWQTAGWKAAAWIGWKGKSAS